MRNPDIILGPVITEKSKDSNKNGVYVFKVDKKATKKQIKSEIEKAFGVTVLNVNTLNTKSKKARKSKYVGKTKTYKKAIVTLEQGNSIEM